MRNKMPIEMKAFIDSMPKYTASQKIIVKAIQMIDRSMYEEEEKNRNQHLFYAKGLLESFTFVDDKKRGEE